MLMGDWSAYFKDAQVRTYLLFFMISAGGVCLWLFFSEGLSLGVSLSQGFFRTSSIISTTGFQGTHTWTPPLMVLSVILSIIGGCTGSTAGGIKVFRIQILYRVIRAQMYKLLHPHGVFAPVYNKRNVADQVIYAVFSLFAVYVISIGFFSLSFTLCGLSAITSLDLTINILSNSGFSYTGSDLAAFSQPVQWLLILGMLLGRLEFMTLLVIALPPFWKR